MPTVHPEFEAKYEVDGDAALPDLVELVRALQHERSGDGPDAAVGDGPWAEGEVAEHDLSATYFDTPDLRLAAAGLTLRRRTGGPDAGWHLEVPSPCTAGPAGASAARRPAARRSSCSRWPAVRPAARTPRR